MFEDFLGIFLLVVWLLKEAGFLSGLPALLLYTKLWFMPEEEVPGFWPYFCRSFLEGEVRVWIEADELRAVVFRFEV